MKLTAEQDKQMSEQLKKYKFFGVITILQLMGILITLGIVATLVYEYWR